MSNSPRPTLQQLETLVSYLPLLYAAGFTPVERWDGGDKRHDGSFTLPYPKYNPLVEEFYGHVSGDGWLDYNYNPEQAYQMLKDEAAVKRASLEEVKSMLTFCVRGERFSDGHWGEMIEKGYIQRILKRLNDLKSDFSK